MWFISISFLWNTVCAINELTICICGDINMKVCTHLIFLVLLNEVFSIYLMCLPQSELRNNRKYISFWKICLLTDYNFDHLNLWDGHFFYPIFNMQKQHNIFIFSFVFYQLCIVQYYIDAQHKSRTKSCVSIVSKWWVNLYSDFLKF